MSVGNGNSPRGRHKVQTPSARKTDFTAVRAVLESVMSGTPAADLVFGVEALGIEDRRLLFAVLWAVRQDVGQTCRERAEEIDRLIQAYEFGSGAAADIPSLQAPPSSGPKPVASENRAAGAFGRTSLG